MGIYIGIIEKKGYDPTVFFNWLIVKSSWTDKRNP